MPKTLNIVADAHIWGAESAFSTLPGFDINLRTMESRDINRQALMHADVLLTRSATKVNGDLLAGTPVRFAATATIGDDHYDKSWLENHQVSWANAAGSSTGSVIEYMVSMFLAMHANGVISIPDTTIGIIGVGRIGTALAGICEAIGMQVLLNDPPRARIEGANGFCSLDQLLEQADLLTLHTPLIDEGDDCTRHLLGDKRLNQFHGRGIINAARGGCVDNAALVRWLDGDSSRFAALDCWESEPRPDFALIRHPGMIIATPHIAGHSLDGKAANTLFAYQALCHYLQIEPVWDMQSQLPEPAAPHTVSLKSDVWHTLHAITSHLYPLAEDNKTMKSWPDLTEGALPNAFSQYRRHYPVRRSWAAIPVHLNQADSRTLQLAQAIGIKLV
ncbi:MAG: erythronate-4-phosphate dehydrogenase [Zetaproteobacteria bacterium CG_4_9_14_3_um_filter_53_7]|nr:MAG: erythronate-4-phosphate dehydrogenase [Zetaproteobacteria bacterium CG_4_9_14_3_um_filter_53_7]